jgi:hypothetical protein
MEARQLRIVSHKEKGVGAWTDAELKRVLTEGIGRDGRVLKLPMARQRYFSKMTAFNEPVIRETIRSMDMVAIGMVVLTSRRRRTTAGVPRKTVRH